MKSILGCGHTFQSESGELSSPNYPNAQKTRKFCTWTIEVPPHKRIELSFKDINMKTSASCLYGFIQVLDGDSNDSPELGRFCQDILPRSIVSSKNKIVIGYQSDGNGDSRGFKLEWRSMNERQDGEKPVMLSGNESNPDSFSFLILRTTKIYFFNNYPYCYPVTQAACFTQYFFASYFQQHLVTGHLQLNLAQ